MHLWTYAAGEPDKLRHIWILNGQFEGFWIVLNCDFLWWQWPCPDGLSDCIGGPHWSALGAQLLIVPAENGHLNHIWWEYCQGSNQHIPALHSIAKLFCLILKQPGDFVFSKCNFVLWYCYFSLKLVQLIEYLVSTGFWWPGALAPGHQQLQCCVRTVIHKVLYEMIIAVIYIDLNRFWCFKLGN